MGWLATAIKDPPNNTAMKPLIQHIGHIINILISFKISPQMFLIQFPKTMHFYPGYETEDILLQFHLDV